MLEAPVRWRKSWRADAAGRRIADNHYNRQKHGAAQFVPPGRCVVLVIPDEAFWVTSWPFPQYVKHAWPNAWVCSAFRNERSDLHLSSELVTEALAGTRFYWEAPAWGMITFVDSGKTRHKRDPGRCFRKAGFHVAGRAPARGTYRPVCICDGTGPVTAGGLVALHMSASAMPPAVQPVGAQAMLGLG